MKTARWLVYGEIINAIPVRWLPSGVLVMIRAGYLGYFGGAMVPLLHYE